MVDKSTNKVQFRQMEKSIQNISTIGIGFGNRTNQTICIADCENLAIGHSLHGEEGMSNIAKKSAVVLYGRLLCYSFLFLFNSEKIG